ncbi:conserved protein, unknown function [Plasmodium yoelii]|nr:conserved protein, unknown function [Plasmodium yoelii]CDU16995.1 conserved Plasmodium protein, unknown function [Plasmodium yoelii]VTZ75364.1 conserved protein, unknown function [Plasmodium yoelii]|eukprot:XP_022813168.1 conserved protein, unknown function [Plasmodium yoelii]
MKLIILIYIYSITFFMVSSIKIRRNNYYINSNIFRSKNTNSLTHNKSAYANNNNKGQTYIQKAQSCITDIRKDFFKQVINNINTYGIAIAVFAFSSLLGLFYKTKNKKNNENATKNLNNDENELSKYRCMKCNLLIYPAKGREQKFLKDNYICPNCGQSDMGKYNTRK